MGSIDPLENFPDRVPYRPSTPPSNPAAERYVPKYLFKGFQDPDGRPEIKISDDFMGTRRPLRIGVLGAGISSINFLHYLFEHMHSQPGGRESIEVVVYETASDVGGTWLSNRYPGCRCDIPSMVYQFSWRPHIWSEFYAPQEENLAYIQDTAREEGFYQYMNFNHEILQASWTDDESRWTLKVHDAQNDKIFEDKVDVYCEFNGPVSKPILKPVKGIDAFKGRVIHPGYWPDDLDLKGKNVVLVGYGSSGVQLAPAIINDVNKLYTWYRHPTFIVPPPAQDWSAKNGANFKYSDEQKELLKDPDLYLAYRKAIDAAFYTRYSYTVNGSETAQKYNEMVKNYMRDKLKHKPELLERILPKDFSLGCRRQAFAYGYMEAITSPKAHVFTTEPQGFTAHGIIDDHGVEHPADIVIAATGYDQSHVPRYAKLVNGHDLRKTFEAHTSPPSYMALMLKGMPNYFNPASAYGPWPQGNFFTSSDVFVKYIVRTLDKMQFERIVSVRPKDSAVDHWVRHANAFLKRTSVAGPCVAWYKGNDGISKPPALWPGARLQFIKAMETPRFEDFEIQYENPEDEFAYLANGWTLEFDGTEGTDPMSFHGQPKRTVGKEELERLRGVDPTVTELTSGAVAAEGPRL